MMMKKSLRAIHIYSLNTQTHEHTYTGTRTHAPHIFIMYTLPRAWPLGHMHAFTAVVSTRRSHPCQLTEANNSFTFTSSVQSNSTFVLILDFVVLMCFVDKPYHRRLYNRNSRSLV